MPFLTDDPRKVPCPSCGKTGIYLDPVSNGFRCKFCKESNLRLDVPRQESALPPVPPNAAATDVVREYFTDDKGTKHLVATIHAPLNKNVPQTAFDPNSMWARIAKKRFADAIARRKRLNRDITRRAKERGEAIGPWSARYEAERGPISPSVADDMLRQVKESMKRKRRQHDEDRG